MDNYHLRIGAVTTGDQRLEFAAMATFTKTELKKFDRLSEQCSSRDQMERISGRLALNAFIKEHGREKCDAMWNEIMVREGRAKTER